eukprot:3477162-Ditylum_brightwellii.AAC.1
MEEWRRKQSNNQQDRVNKKDLADKKSKPKANKLEAEKEVHPEDGKTSDNERETKTDVQSQVQQDVHAEVEVNASPCADNTEIDIDVEEANLSNPGRQVYMANPAHDLQTNFSNLLLQRVQMPFILSRGVDLPHVMARMQGGNITGALPMLHLPAMQGASYATSDGFVFSVFQPELIMKNVDDSRCSAPLIRYDTNGCSCSAKTSHLNHSIIHSSSQNNRASHNPFVDSPVLSVTSA